MSNNEHILQIVKDIWRKGWNDAADRNYDEAAIMTWQEQEAAAIAALVDKAYNDGCRFGSDMTMAAYKGGERQVDTLIDAAVVEELESLYQQPDYIIGNGEHSLKKVIRSRLATRKGEENE